MRELYSPITTDWTKIFSMCGEVVFRTSEGEEYIFSSEKIITPDEEILAQNAYSEKTLKHFRTVLYTVEYDAEGYRLGFTVFRKGEPQQYRSRGLVQEVVHQKCWRAVSSSFSLCRQNSMSHYLEIRLFGAKKIEAIVESAGVSDIHDLAGCFNVNLMACVMEGETISFGVSGSQTALTEFRNCIRDLSRNNS